MLRKSAVLVASFIAVAVTAIPAQAASSRDLCMAQYPSPCAEIVTYNPQGVPELAIVNGATDPTTSQLVQNFQNWWDVNVWLPYWQAGQHGIPYLLIYTSTTYGCNNFGTVWLDICNGSNSPGNRGQTSANQSGADLLAGSMSVIDISQPISSAQGAICHELLLAMGYVEWEGSPGINNDPGGAGCANNPLNGGAYPNSYDESVVNYWYTYLGQ